MKENKTFLRQKKNYATWSALKEIVMLLFSIRRNILSERKTHVQVGVNYTRVNMWVK